MKRLHVRSIGLSLIVSLQLTMFSLRSISQVASQSEPGTIGISLLQLYSEHQPTKRGPFVVRHVEAQSAANDAGIKAGDLILATNGKTVLGSDAGEVVRSLAGSAGTPIELSIIDAGGNQKKVNLIRKPYTPHVNPVSDPFYYSLPGDWTMDLRYNFPLEWSPTLNHKGFEDLAFAPGFDDPTSPEYHSYLLFWWLEGKATFTADELQTEMVTYFRGLAEQRGRNNHFAPDLARVTARYTPTRTLPGLLGGAQATNFSGQVTVVDRKGNIVALSSEISVAQCGSDHTVVYFAMSKEPRAAALWQRLDHVRDSFRCLR